MVEQADAVRLLGLHHAAGEEQLPHTVRDAVLARAARLSPPAATLVDAVAVAPPHVELWLLEALAGDGVEGLEECLASGVLRHASDGVAFVVPTVLRRAFMTSGNYINKP